MEYIDLPSADKPREIDLVIKTKSVPKRIIIEYELSTKIKDISKEIQDNPEPDMPR